MPTRGCYCVLCLFITILHNHWFSLLAELFNLKTIIFCLPHSRLEVWENVWLFSWSMILYFTLKKCMLLYVWDYIWLTDSWKIGEYETIYKKLYILPIIMTFYQPLVRSGSIFDNYLLSLMVKYTFGFSPCSFFNSSIWIRLPTLTIEGTIFWRKLSCY